jgi:hypothetical protein
LTKTTAPATAPKKNKPKIEAKIILVFDGFFGAISGVSISDLGSGGGGVDGAGGVGEFDDDGEFGEKGRLGKTGELFETGESEAITSGAGSMGVLGVIFGWFKLSGMGKNFTNNKSA